MNHSLARCCVGFLAVLLATPCAAQILPAAGAAHGAEPSAEDRAVAFLSREVPKWPFENKCYSCHNNGDGARALYAARRLGIRIEEAALQSTTAWLAQPDRWEQNGGKAEFSDKKLAAIQFAAALAAAESYAQRLSTTGWATLALLATREAKLQR